MAKHIQILVGLGGNLSSSAGAPKHTIEAAIVKLEEVGLSNIVVSGFFRTKPVPDTGQPDFINCALVAETSHAPQQLLDIFQDVERELGRRPGERWSARTLDIDLLAYGEKILPGPQAWHAVTASADPAAILPEPVVPHPRMHIRAFVLAPLEEIAPDWLHPVYGKSVHEMLQSEIVQEQIEAVWPVSADQQ